ncbi:hypothetical protein J6590_087869 [Homalodisca vitripennis]|nr:hypothetical protein J6590_087869 [Homalodisca vitripennis]
MSISFPRHLLLERSHAKISPCRIPLQRITPYREPLQNFPTWQTPVQIFVCHHMTMPLPPMKRKTSNKESDAEEHNESISSGESNLELPVGVEKPSDEDALCIFCGDPFSKDVRGELWIQCQLCDEWCHSECAGVEKDIYVCDFCK